MSTHFKTISGIQYRSIDCYWGNQSCFGYKNQREHQYFCNGDDLLERFCEKISIGENYEMTSKNGRTFYCSGRIDDCKICKRNLETIITTECNEEKWSKKIISFYGYKSSHDFFRYFCRAIFHCTVVYTIYKVGS